MQCQTQLNSLARGGLGRIDDAGRQAWQSAKLYWTPSYNPQLAARHHQPQEQNDGIGDYIGLKYDINGAGKPGFWGSTSIVTCPGDEPQISVGLSPQRRHRRNKERPLVPLDLRHQPYASAVFWIGKRPMTGKTRWHGDRWRRLRSAKSPRSADRGDDVLRRRRH